MRKDNDPPFEENKDVSASLRKHRMKPLNRDLSPLHLTKPIMDESLGYGGSLNTSNYKDDYPTMNYGDLGNNIESLVNGLVQRRKEEERRLRQQKEDGCQVS